MSSMPISMRGFAEVVHAAPKRKESTLRKYTRSKNTAEGKGRSNYYVKALAAIHRHHKQELIGRDEILKQLAKDSTSADTKLRRTKAAHNLRVANEYLETFGHRRFTLTKVGRLYFTHGSLVVSAQPDLVVLENGRLKLIKLNCCLKDHPTLMVMTMLQVLHLAAGAKGISLPEAGVECLQLNSKSAIKGSVSHFKDLASINKACDEVIDLWPLAA